MKPERKQLLRKTKLSKAVKEINSLELQEKAENRYVKLLVGFYWIIGLAGILSCVLTLFKYKYRHAKIMLIVFMIQFVSTYQMGFLTFNWK